MQKVENGAYHSICDLCDAEIQGTLHYKPPTEAWVFACCAICYSKATSFIAQAEEPE